MPMKNCAICGSDLPPRRSKYCSHRCQRKKSAEYAMQQRIARGDPTVGLGKGGSNLKGKEHNRYRSGMGNFYAIRKQMREEVKECQRCHADLTHANRYEWCVHHIDHDRTNNVRENFEMLCKRCHQVEHECWKAFN